MKYIKLPKEHMIDCERDILLSESTIECIGCPFDGGLMGTEEAEKPFVINIYMISGNDSFALHFKTLEEAEYFMEFKLLS